jgi:predicted RNA-binding Zn-ribbon protein involved in translation (DUF1610 family)
MSKIPISRCSSSKKPVSPDDVGTVRFLCPNCGNFTIVRSSQSRSLGNPYLCHNCGFKGP